MALDTIIVILRQFQKRMETLKMKQDGIVKSMRSALDAVRLERIKRQINSVYKKK